MSVIWMSCTYELDIVKALVDHGKGRLCILAEIAEVEVATQRLGSDGGQGAIDLGSSVQGHLAAALVEVEPEVAPEQ